MHPKPSYRTGRDFVPPAPFDVVFYRKELRMYKKQSGELTYSITLQNVYYHMKKACHQKKMGTSPQETFQFPTNSSLLLQRIMLVSYEKSLDLPFKDILPNSYRSKAMFTTFYEV